MKESAGQPVQPPLRTWRPMAAWTGALLLALGLAWFVAAGVVPVWQTRNTVVGLAANLTSHQGDGDKSPCTAAVNRLGGRAVAGDKLSLYAKLPERLAPEKTLARTLAFVCSDPEIFEVWEVVDRSKVRFAFHEIPTFDEAEPHLRSLGGPQAAASKLGRFLSLPRSAFEGERDVNALARRGADSYPSKAAILLGFCGKAAVPEVDRLLQGEGCDQQKCGLLCCMIMGWDARPVLPRIRALAEGAKDQEVRSVATKMISTIAENPPLYERGMQ